MFKLRLLIVTAFIAAVSAGALAEPKKKSDADHPNLAAAYSSLELAKAALSAVRWEDEKGTRAHALSDIQGALKECADAFKAAGSDVPAAARPTIVRNDDAANLEVARREVRHAREMLDKAEGDFKGNKADALKLTESAGKSLDGALNDFKKESEMKKKSDELFTGLPAQASRAVQFAHPGYLLEKFESKNNDDERGKTFILHGRAKGHKTDVEVGEDGRIWSSNVTPHAK